MKLERVTDKDIQDGTYTIPEGVTKIGDSAFFNCKNLTQIMLPEGVDEIGDFAFFNCKSLRQIVLPKGVTRIGKSAFEYCKSLTEITLSEGLTEIGIEAFRNCVHLKRIEIPDSVVKIGAFAFQNCINLETIFVESTTEIGIKAFEGCPGCPDTRRGKDKYIEIMRLKNDQDRKKKILEEIAIIAGDEVALEATRRLNYKTHAYSHAEYVNQLETFLSLLKKGIEKENALDLMESGWWRNGDNFLLY